MYNPEIAKSLATQRTAELRASGRRVVRSSSCSRRSGAPGPLAVHAGRAFVTLGWRLGGTAALPSTVRRRLA